MSKKFFLDGKIVFLSPLTTKTDLPMQNRKGFSKFFQKIFPGSRNAPFSPLNN